MADLLFSQSSYLRFNPKLCARRQPYPPLGQAILRTLTYADLYDYAMTREEIHRYLIGCLATRDQVDAVLDDHTQLDGYITRSAEFVTLARRAHLSALRYDRRSTSATLWQKAKRYARWLAHFPFVKMVAITGALAVENAPAGDDIDMLIITAPAHLWTVRGFAVALVRLARLFGDRLCPNYIVSEPALYVAEQNLYSAHEIAQAVPIYGIAVFDQYHAINQWVENFLPNAYRCQPRLHELPLGKPGRALKQFGETVLSTRLGKRIEQWEQTRKTAKLRAQVLSKADWSSFTPECCKGHFEGHARRAMSEYQKRWSALDE